MICRHFISRKECESLAFEAIKKLAEGVSEYLEIPMEKGLLDSAAAVFRSFRYDMEEAISVFLRRIIQTSFEAADRKAVEQRISDIADETLDDMATQPLLLPRSDIFSVELSDHAKAGFCTHCKPCFGSLEDIAEFRHALRQDEKHIPEDMTFTSAKLYGSRYEIRKSGMYKHTHIRGFPYSCGGTSWKALISGWATEKSTIGVSERG